jgi:HlyD family secretion protein
MSIKSYNLLKLQYDFRLPTAALVLLAAACGRSPAPPVVGTIERHRYDLAATASEVIIEQPVREGDAVQAGQILSRLDDRGLRAARDAAAADVARAQRHVDELVNGPRADEINQARAQLAAAEAQRAQAEREFQRLADLAARQLVAQSQFDQQRAQRDGAVAGVDAARAQLRLLEEGTREEQVGQARAALVAARAVLAQAEVSLGRLALTAPVDGRVEALPYRLGERPALGAPVVILLASGAPFARVYVPEGRLATMRPGQSVSVRIDGVAQPQRGVVRYLAGEASFTPYFSLTQRDRSRLAFLAEIDLPGPEASGLPVGLPVEVTPGEAR